MFLSSSSTEVSWCFCGAKRSGVRGCSLSSLTRIKKHPIHYCLHSQAQQSCTSSLDVWFHCVTCTNMQPRFPFTSSHSPPTEFQLTGNWLVDVLAILQWHWFLLGCCCMADDLIPRVAAARRLQWTSSYIWASTCASFSLKWTQAGPPISGKQRTLCSLSYILRAQRLSSQSVFGQDCSSLL